MQNIIVTYGTMNPKPEPLSIGILESMRNDHAGMTGFAPMIKKMAKHEDITFMDGDVMITFGIDETSDGTWTGSVNWMDNKLAVNIQRAYRNGYLIETNGRLTTSVSSQNRTNIDYGDRTPSAYRTGEVLTAFVKDMRDNPDEKSKDMTGMIQ